MDIEEKTAVVDSVLAALSGNHDSEGAVTEALATFSVRHGLAPIVFDEGGVASITAGDGFRLDLSLMPGFPGILAIALIDIDADDRDRLAPLLLRLNMSGADTRGAIFTRLPPDHDILLCRQIVATGDHAGFADDLSGFIELASEWQRMLQDLVDLPDHAFAEALRADGEPTADQIVQGR